MSLSPEDRKEWAEALKRSTDDWNKAIEEEKAANRRLGLMVAKARDAGITRRRICQITDLTGYQIDNLSRKAGRLPALYISLKR